MLCCLRQFWAILELLEAVPTGLQNERNSPQHLQLRLAIPLNKVNR